jgi:hypothetical protein
MAITGKQRSRRIDRNYTSSQDPSILWKRRFGWAGLILGALYGLWLLTPSAAKQLSTGTLSKAHHAWNETGCDQCHAPWSPINTASFARSPEVIADNNQRCNACHRMADHYSHSNRAFNATTSIWGSTITCWTSPMNPASVATQTWLNSSKMRIDLSPKLPASTPPTGFLDIQTSKASPKIQGPSNSATPNTCGQDNP